LIFVGVKMALEFWHGGHLIPPAASLVVILALLGISIAASLAAKPPDDAPPAPGN
jgi:hypothetical protein